MDKAIKREYTISSLKLKKNSPFLPNQTIHKKALYMKKKLFTAK